jgi:glutamine amidotransferase of anthranilate synthase or aminodeoxychorismate synthase
MTLLVIDNYDSFTFNLVQSLRTLSSVQVKVARNDAISMKDIKRLNPIGIVISPGPGHPANQNDFGINTRVIRSQARLDCPILGICLGHQGIVHVLGGTIDRADEIMHGKRSLLNLDLSSPLFGGLTEQLIAMRYHSLVARDESLPACLEVVAREERSGTIMAVQHRRKPIYGLQFHPESIGTPDGAKILGNFIEICQSRRELRKLG